MRIDLNISYVSDVASDSLSGRGNLGEFGFSVSGAETEVSSKEDYHSDKSIYVNEVLEEGDSSTRNTSTKFFEQERSDATTNSVDVLRNKSECMLSVGSVFDTLDEVFEAYCDYGGLMGFSARRSTQAYFTRTEIACSKVFVCSCAGLTDKKCSNGRVAAFKKQTYRTNCGARLRVGRTNVEAPWIVTLFEKQHNHQLLEPDASYLLRSARNIRESQKSLLIGMKSSGIGVSRAYRFLEKEAGSRANIGFTRTDVYNELNREARNLSKVANSDVNRLLEFFTEKGRSDPSFYWKVKVGKDGRLKNLFFRDSRCLIDYRHFGDVMSVDATYKTNKYDLICVPIVGINHHRTNVIFAIAFLSNEKTESYSWLFNTFLESMYQKEPDLIFSDQDQALMNGLDLSFREASHRLCQWHINKNAAKQFGKLNHDKRFKNLWYQCMNGCESEEEFESTWVSMIVENNLSENRWFSTMYHLRKRWSSAFTRHKFSGGLHATSRSEVTNKVIKELCNSTSTVHDFVIGFETILKTWRQTEFEEDTLCRGMPGMFVEQTCILIQVGELCTRNIFKSFEYELLHSVSVKMTHEPLDMNDDELVFKVCSRSAFTGCRTVRFNQATKMARCSCHMWETEGIMCRHMFRVYFHLNMDSVPDEMLMKRWRKDAKDRIALIRHESDDTGSNTFNNMLFVNHNTKRVYDMLVDCKNDAICRSAMDEYITNMEDAMQKLRNDLNSVGHSGGPNKSFKEPLHRPIKNPISKKKGRHRRKMFSKYWAVRGLEESAHLDEQSGSQFCGTQANNEEFVDDTDRFSVD
ncbi:protein FAR1-RELATED SEQUENCE 5-like [Salvia miltiorrhiza]|uniref:protein FAR1-RELATED SEQUENCE 5-like n=1 Tax=Salvia miltiorrhiza TaxID=226208 RepID=UPI0025ABEC72|nr:protein FAR1-RELATED SEQUENCE 5-like [Salvia miltiorrhiza]